MIGWGLQGIVPLPAGERLVSRGDAGATGQAPSAPNPVSRSYVPGFGSRPFGEVLNIHSSTHVRGVLWYGANGVSMLIHHTFLTGSAASLILSKPI